MHVRFYQSVSDLDPDQDWPAFCRLSVYEKKAQLAKKAMIHMIYQVLYSHLCVSEMLSAAVMVVRLYSQHSMRTR